MAIELGQSGRIPEARIEARGRESLVAPHLLRGVTILLERSRDLNALLPDGLQRPESHYAYLGGFMEAFLSDRITRAREVKSEEYTEIARVARGLLPVSTYTVTCVDGRVIPTHFGFTADVAGSMRVAGGDPGGFYRQDGKLHLDPDSDTAHEVRSALLTEEKGTGVIAEIFDNHIECAAGEGRERSRRKTNDGGLLANISRKKEMILATHEMIEHDSELEGRKMIGIQTSFDPKDGYIFMGLERNESLAIGKQKGGYKRETIQELVTGGDVLSSRVLVEDPVINSLFDQHKFTLDWDEGKYVASAQRFWMSIWNLKDKILPIIQEKVIKLYPHLASPNEISQYELQERAMVLFLSSFTGYLNNIPSSDQSHPQGNYGYQNHVEEGIKVSEGTYPPYKIQMFAVFVNDKGSLVSNIKLTHGLVRANRDAGRVIDRSGAILDKEELVGAPVPLVIKSIVRKKEPLSDGQWERIGKTDFSDLPDKPWDLWNDEQFHAYLESKGFEASPVTQAMNRLRRDMARLYRDPELAEHLIENNIVAFPVISDGRREPRVVIPFIKRGTTGIVGQAA